MNGILFKPWKIKAIAEDDGEWQTRRVIKPQPCDDKTFIYADGYCSLQAKNGYAPYAKSRYQVGEVVYIKEAWRPNWASERSYGVPGIQYKLDNAILARAGAGKYTAEQFHDAKWHSPMMMPEWAARYFIKITDIRAERLQEITEADAIAEGIEEWHGMFKEYDKPDSNPGWTRDPILSYRTLWNSINPKYPWESNPFVFVYSFKKAEK